uniref:Macaca fascicularis brain cDNA clone: QflA-21005, similar to human similar to expressed sequence AW121567 (LOC387944), mRNA, RefSeq: XM_370731.1 n=1 Tax=Macaca fascicularis TaxID=9541 RepID=I7GIM1_MACFA|nr:unnamed protein product [Macaca fascicularis]
MQGVRKFFPLTMEVGFHCDFSSVAVIYEHILAIVITGNKGIADTYLDFFSSLIVVEETLEMLKHLQYTEYIQFYSSISLTYGLKLFQVYSVCNSALSQRNNFFLKK